MSLKKDEEKVGWRRVFSQKGVFHPIYVGMLFGYTLGLVLPSRTPISSSIIMFLFILFVNILDERWELEKEGYKLTAKKEKRGGVPMSKLYKKITAYECTWCDCIYKTAKEARECCPEERVSR